MKTSRLPPQESERSVKCSSSCFPTIGGVMSLKAWSGAGLAALSAVFVANAVAQQMLYGPPVSVENARKAAAASVVEARKNGWNMAVAIVDPGGHLVYFERMDTVQFGSIAIAQDKAHAAAAFRRSEEHTSELQSLA